MDLRQQIIFGILICAHLFFPYMAPETGLSNEEKGKAVLRLTFVVAGIEVAAAVILIAIPMVVMGVDGYANGIPLTVLPFVAVGAINFAYFHVSLKKINES